MLMLMMMTAGKRPRCCGERRGSMTSASPSFSSEQAEAKGTHLVDSVLARLLEGLSASMRALSTPASRVLQTRPDPQLWKSSLLLGSWLARFWQSDMQSQCHATRPQRQLQLRSFSLNASPLLQRTKPCTQHAQGDDVRMTPSVPAVHNANNDILSSFDRQILRRVNCSSCTCTSPARRRRRRGGPP